MSGTSFFDFWHRTFVIVSLVAETAIWSDSIQELYRVVDDEDEFAS